MRTRFWSAGIARPLEQLASMHDIADMAEMVLIEQCVKDEDRNELMSKLYRPEFRDDEDDDDVPPPGFDLDDMEASFDAFMGRAR